MGDMSPALGRVLPSGHPRSVAEVPGPDLMLAMREVTAIVAGAR